MDSRGSTLFIAGNAPVVPGKMVWTDGKIIYGSIPTGGEAYIPVSDESGYLWLADGGNICKIDALAEEQVKPVTESRARYIVGSDGGALFMYYDKAWHYGENTYPHADSDLEIMDACVIHNKDNIAILDITADYYLEAGNYGEHVETYTTWAGNNWDGIEGGISMKNAKTTYTIIGDSYSYMAHIPAWLGAKEHDEEIKLDVYPVIATVTFNAAKDQESHYGCINLYKNGKKIVSFSLAKIAGECKAKAVKVLGEKISAEVYYHRTTNVNISAMACHPDGTWQATVSAASCWRMYAHTVEEIDGRIPFEGSLSMGFLLKGTLGGYSMEKSSEDAAVWVSPDVVRIATDYVVVGQADSNTTYDSKLEVETYADEFEIVKYQTDHLTSLHYYWNSVLSVQGKVTYKLWFHNSDRYTFNFVPKTYLELISYREDSIVWMLDKYSVNINLDSNRIFIKNTTVHFDKIKFIVDCVEVEGGWLVMDHVDIYYFSRSGSMQRLCRAWSFRTFRIRNIKKLRSLKKLCMRGGN